MNTCATRSSSVVAMLNLAQFESTPLQYQPYDYLVVPQFIQANVKDAVVADFPVIDKAGSFPLQAVECGPAFIELLQQLEGPEFRAAVERKFKLSLEGKPTMLTVRGHTDATDGQIHTDSKTKLITVLLYFNTDWQDSGGRLRVLRSGEDLEDYAAEVAPAFGTLLAFRRSDNSWHGHHPYVGVRRTIQLNWVISEQVKRHEQQRHNVSAFFKKLFRK